MSIPVTIIGGYLGAGKTSLINHVLAGRHGLRVTVLVNDFGAINIDASLIADSADQTISLANGCACCAIQDDLGAALDAQLSRAIPPDHIMIEGSGVAEPARLRRTVEAWPGLQLDAVVTLVDAETIRDRAHDKFVGRLARRQLNDADLLVVNKRDLVSDEHYSVLVAWLADHAPTSRIVPAVYGKVDPLVLIGATDARVVHDPSGILEPADALFHAAKLEVSVPVRLEHVIRGLATLPASIHRVKGFVTDHVTGERKLLQAVGQRASLSALTSSRADNRADELIVIGTSKRDLALVADLIAASSGPT